MSMQHQEVVTRSINSKLSLGSSSVAEALLRRIVGCLERGKLVIETPTGDRLVLCGRRPGPLAKVTIHSWRCLWRLVSGWDIGFAESYIAGEWSSPDLVALLTLACNNSDLVKPLKALRGPRLWLRLRHAMNRNTRRGSRRNVAVHYDLGNEFYQQWLDQGMTYSSALFSRAAQTLEEAQDSKLDRVISLLDLAGGEKVLEIGCGWGSLAKRMMERHSCAVTGLTLSSEQLAFAQRLLRDRTAAGRCVCKIIAMCAVPSIVLFRSKCWRLSVRHTGLHTSRNCETACDQTGWPYCKSSLSMTLDLETIVAGPISSRNTSSLVACFPRSK